jgi:hypothetical protein
MSRSKSKLMAPWRGSGERRAPMWQRRWSGAAGAAMIAPGAGGRAAANQNVIGGEGRRLRNDELAQAFAAA